MKIVLATGGTGGHIYPATALAEKLMLDDPKNEIVFIGNEDRMEAIEIPKLGYRFIGIKAAKFNESTQKMKAIGILYRAYKQCLKILEADKYDIVIGFGGYVSVPVIMAACKLGIKTMIHEQNSFTGMANRMLGHFVNKVCIVYPNAAEAFASRKVVRLGNPRESSVLNFEKDKNIFKQFGLNCDKKTLLIVMGSLGSESVNQKMTGILEVLKNKDYNVLYVTGRNHYEQFANLQLETETLKIVPYISQFNIAGNCALVMSRGGATSASEYMALGVPTIIVPSPNVTNNHQYINAKALLDNGASYLLEEKEMNIDNTVSLIDSLIHDDEKLAYMSSKAKEMSHPNAAFDMIKLIKEMVNKK